MIREEWDDLSVGERVWFEDERMPMTVQAVSLSGRFVAVTRPFAPRQTVLYSVLDVVDGVRGVDDSIGNSLGYETRADCQRAMRLFEKGEFGFSKRRRPIPLRIRKRQRADPGSSGIPDGEKVKCKSTKRFSREW